MCDVDWNVKKIVIEIGTVIYAEVLVLYPGEVYYVTFDYL